MDDHIWRVPVIEGVMVCSAILQFAAGAVTSAILRRRPSTGVRLAAVLTIVAIAVAFGFVLRATVLRLAHALQISVIHIDPGPLGYVAPSVVALFFWVVADRLLRGAWASYQACAFYGWVLFFTAANVINFCSPGWCMTLGFPMAWHGWSDAILEGAEGLKRVLYVAGALVDLCVFVVGGWAITRRVSR